MSSNEPASRNMSSEESAKLEASNKSASSNDDMVNDNETVSSYVYTMKNTVPMIEREFSTDAEKRCFEQRLVT